MLNTLKLLVRAHADSNVGYEVDNYKIGDVLGWQVIHVERPEESAARRGLSLEEAELYAGLCNLLDSDDYGDLEPYLKELLPNWFS